PFGNLGRGGVQTNTALSIANHPDGLPDYDWYKWVMSTGGTFTAHTQRTAGGDLELHIFTVQSDNTLVELTSSTAPGLASRTLQVSVTVGQIILVEVKGRNSSTGIQDQGTYDMDVRVN